KVHHLAAKAGVRQVERIEHGIDVLHAQAIDQHVGGGVVADRDHHRREIAQCDARDAGSETAHDVAVRDKVRGLHGVKIGELELALLRLTVEFAENSDLDRAGLCEDFVGAKKNVVSCGEVFDGNAHNAV